MSFPFTLRVLCGDDVRGLLVEQAAFYHRTLHLAQVQVSKFPLISMRLLRRVSLDHFVVTRPSTLLATISPLMAIPAVDVTAGIN
jgi:hypothetical protein